MSFRAQSPRGVASEPDAVLTRCPKSGDSAKVQASQNGSGTSGGASKDKAQWMWELESQVINLP